MKKTPPTGSASVYIFSGAKVIAEYVSGAPATSPTSEYIYSGSQLIATLSGGATVYHHSDHLSARVSTDTNGNAVRSFGHYPSGETWYETGTASKWKFTSYERDSESLNDYAIERTHINRLARFSSPDPLAGSISDPQSLNRYAYSLNDPPNMADPTGLTTSGWGGPCYWAETSGAQVLVCEVFVGDGGSHNRIAQSPEVGGGGPRRFVNKKVLAKCLKDHFGVTMTQFTESTQGTNGSFTGQGPDTLSNGGNDTSIHVTNDIQTYSGEKLKALRDSRGNPPLPQGTTALDGLTLYDQPYVNYTANNLSQLNQSASIAAETQVHELGNSMHFITGAAFNPATVPGSDRDAGQALENCVRKRGGFIKP